MILWLYISSLMENVFIANNGLKFRGCGFMIDQERVKKKKLIGGWLTLIDKNCVW